MLGARLSCVAIDRHWFPLWIANPQPERCTIAQRLPLETDEALRRRFKATSPKISKDQLAGTRIY